MRQNKLRSAPTKICSTVHELRYLFCGSLIDPSPSMSLRRPANQPRSRASRQGPQDVSIHAFTTDLHSSLSPHHSTLFLPSTQTFRLHPHSPLAVHLFHSLIISTPVMKYVTPFLASSPSTRVSSHVTQPPHLCHIPYYFISSCCSPKGCGCCVIPGNQKLNSIRCSPFPALST